MARTRRILVVDDADLTRVMLADILSQAGFEVVGEATDGNEAVEKYRSLRPDLVVMDMVLPFLNGIDALREIRQTDPAALIVMASAMGHESLRLKALEAGAREFIVKPFDPDDIVRVLEQVLAS